ncbi:MAG TPA: hypothetical protein PKA68_16130 [Arachnia sp.]|nr:hypothetical protein [Arachnia sp.]
MAEAVLDNNPGVAFLEGFIASLAVAALSPGDVSFTATIAIACAVVLTWQWKGMHTAVLIVFGVIGAIATTQAVAAYLGDDSCLTWIPLWGRILLLLGMAIAFGWGFVHTMFMRKDFKDVGAIGLGWFGMVELLTFASTATAGAGGLGIVVVVVGVLVLGALLGAKPALTTLVIGVGMGVMVVLGSSLFGTPAATGAECLLVQDAWATGFLYLVAFVPATLVWVIFIRPFFRKRG